MARGRGDTSLLEKELRCRAGMNFATRIAPPTAIAAATSTAMPSASVKPDFAAAITPTATSDGSIDATRDAAPMESVAKTAVSVGRFATAGSIFPL